MVFHNIQPKIDIDLKPMNNLSKETQSILCSCEKKCKRYIHLDEYGRFCEKDALNIAYHMFAIVKNLSVPQTNPEYRSWTFAEEKVIMNWYNHNKKIVYGDRRILANLLKRNYSSVVSKIDHMKRGGKI